VQDRNELRLARNRLALANEELRRLNRLKSLFLSIAAHDLRSPLTAVRGYADLASRALPPEMDTEAGEYLSIITSLVDSLNRLISDFLDLDIIEQGSLKIRLVACELNPMVLEVAEVMSAVARRKGVSIATSLSPDLPPVHADPDRVRQILFNLITNAVKYTDERDSVIVETNAETDGVSLRVSDHGPGIPEAELPRLFDLYHRTEQARKSKTQGLGLGLFIVKSLVDLQGGQIVVRSEPGKGTQFIVRLPVYQAEFGGKL
jgi:signal transduction histidine kinase